MINPEKKTTLRDGLLNDIKKIKQIYKIKTVFEPITNQIYNVRLQVYINNNTNDSIATSIINRKIFSINIKWNGNKIFFEENYNFKDQNVRLAFRQGILQNNDDDYYLKKDPKELKMYTRGLSIIKERKKLGFNIEEINLEKSVENYLEFES